MGIEFENMSEDMSRRLQEVLETLRIPQQAAPLVRDLQLTGPQSRTPAQAKTPSSDEIPLAAIKRRQQRRIAARGILAHLRARGEVVALGLAIQDLSTGGLFAQCEEPCPVGTKVELELFRPNQPQPLFLAGEVVSAVTKSQAEFRRIKPGMSVRFDPMALSSFTRLRNILAELVPAAAEELRQAPPARTLLPEPEPEPQPPPSYQVTPEIDAARRANFEFNSVEIPVEEAGLHRAEDVHQELERLRTEVKERVQRIAELEAHLLAQQKTS
jgi:Tfp pilus assembly protein PilZ